MLLLCSDFKMGGGKLNIPKQIRIGSMNYDVKISNNVILEENKQCYGHIDFNRHSIMIDNTLQDTQGQEQTFLHELVHGIVNERNFDLKSSDEEMITDELATGLHQVIKDNPFVFQSIKQ